MSHSLPLLSERFLWASRTDPSRCWVVGRDLTSVIFLDFYDPEAVPPLITWILGVGVKQNVKPFDIHYIVTFRQ